MAGGRTQNCHDAPRPVLPTILLSLGRAARPSRSVLNVQIFTIKPSIVPWATFSDHVH